MTTGPMRGRRGEACGTFRPRARARGGGGCGWDAEAAATTRALARMPTDRTASMAAHTEADASARGRPAEGATLVVQRQLRLAKEYVTLAEAFPTRTLKIAKKHVFQMLFGLFMSRPPLRLALFQCHNPHEIFAVIETLEKAVKGAEPSATSTEGGGSPLACGIAEAGVWHRRHAGRGERLKREREAQIADAAAKRRCAAGEDDGATVYSPRLDKERAMTLTPPPA